MKNFLETAIPTQEIIIIDPKLVWIVFLVAMILFALFSAIIFYHWFTLSYAPKVTSKAITIYLVGSGIFITTSLIMVIVYTLSV